MSTIQTIKFSEFTDGGDLNPADITVGLDQTGDNARFANPAPLLAPGTTAQRPASPVNGMVRYNTTILRVEGYANNTWVAFL